MKRGALWKISVATTGEGEEAVGEMLTRIFGEPASTFAHFKTRRTTVAVYCATRPSAFLEKRSRLRAALAKLREFGLSVGPGRVSLRKISRENWAESWKRHFKPLEFGSALLVKPSWSKRRPRRRQAVVTLDPGLSFGTGQHPTTSFCLRELACAASTQRRGMLDIGTGSGILAIAAAKLGFRPVHAFDADKEAVRVARSNARANGVLGLIRITHQNLSRLSPEATTTYDVVCANLISPLLLEEKDRIAVRLKRGGALIVAGILRPEFEEVCAAYEELGLRLVSSLAKGEWRSGCLRKDA